MTPQVRPALAELQPYEPGKPSSQVRRELGLERVIKLASNEGPLGPFPAALEAMAAAAPGLNRYPERELRAGRAARRACTASTAACVALGNGADCDRVAPVGRLPRSRRRGGHVLAVVSVATTWTRSSAGGAGARAAARRRLRPRGAGRADQRAHPDRVRVQPQQPDRRHGHRRRAAAVPGRRARAGGGGRRRGLPRVRRRPAATPTRSPTTCASRPNVVVLRTFSKIYGLAGLRVGYAVGPTRDRPRSRAGAAAVRRQRAGPRGGALASLDDPPRSSGGAS